MAALRIEVRSRAGMVGERGPTPELRRVYVLDRHPGDRVLHALCTTVLADSVVDHATVLPEPPPPDPHRVEVGYLAGVTDTEARQLEAVIDHLGGGQVQAATVRAYRLESIEAGHEATLQGLAAELANPTIERWAIGHLPAPFEPAPPEHATVTRVGIAGLDEAQLAELSRQRLLSLDGAEMAAIAAYYGEVGREPTDAELETLAQTWSEHCAHKTFRAIIEFTELDAEGVPQRQERIDGLLSTYLRAATAAADRPWLRSAFVDNAGIVALDETWDLAIKVETHNHPSALEPFGGANTGVGGVVRDVIGVSARPVACLDVLCFAPPDTPSAAIPPGVLHPARVARGVIEGIGDYGNKLGLPTVAGAVLYHPGYLGNPLVYCGAVGLLAHGSHRTGPRAGDLVVVLGGRTGRDGIHGATFSSAELVAETTTMAGSAVQIGDPITEKATMEVVCAARDAGLYRALTDCGAGGLSSAVGELGADAGVQVDLALVPRKYPGLAPWEVWLSEAQERMVLAVPPENLAALMALGARWHCEVHAIGTFTGDGRLLVCHGSQTVVDLPMTFLHEGCPRRTMHAQWQPPPGADHHGSPDGRGSPDGGGNGGDTGVGARPEPSTPSELAATLLELLALPTVASKADVVATFDHEVRGGTLVRPWCGPNAEGPSDGVVLVPLECWDSGTAAFALGLGINPRYGRLDPYRMALAAVDEAFRNVVAAGADPDRVSLLDNFCWGNPTLPDRLGSLVRATQGCHDAAVAYRAPFVSGKDSLFNEFDGVPIPPTLLITALGVLPDRTKSIGAWPRAGAGRLFLLGETLPELGGSMYHELVGRHGGDVPGLAHGDGLATYRALHRAIVDGLVVAAHDCSEGGLAVALAEFAIAGAVGLDLSLPGVNGTGSGAAGLLGAVDWLFSESSGRFVLQAAAGAEAELVARLAPLSPIVELGAVQADGEAPQLRVRAARSGLPDGEAALLSVPLEALRAAFLGPARAPR